VLFAELIDHFGMVPFGNALHDRQPEAAAFLSTVGGPEKTFAETRQQFGRYARTVVFDDQAAAAVGLRLQADSDSAATPGVTQAVVDQVV